MIACDGTCNAYGKCTCGSLTTGDAVTNKTVRVSLMMADSIDRSEKLMTTIKDAESADARRQAAYDHMCHKQATAWQGGTPVNDNRQSAADTAPQFTKDGRDVATLSDSDRAYHQMLSRDTNAWQR